MNHPSAYLDGHVIVRRNVPRARRQLAKANGGVVPLYTLHIEACAFSKRRGMTPMPAPAQLEVGTVPCSYCKPQMPDSERSESA